MDIGDIDSDGRPDVVVANSSGYDIGVWFNNGGGSFQQNALHCGVNTDLFDLQLADFNGDGLLDVVVPNTTASGFAAAAPGGLAAAPNGVSIALNTGSTVPPRRCTMNGTAGPDRLVGTAGADVICGNGGNDVLVGGGGNDVLLGRPGDDQLRGQNGHDQQRQAARRAGAGPLRGGAGTDAAAGPASARPACRDLGYATLIR